MLNSRVGSSLPQVRQSDSLTFHLHDEKLVSLPVNGSSRRSEEEEGRECEPLYLAGPVGLKF